MRDSSVPTTMKKRTLPLIMAAVFLITSCASRVKEIPAEPPAPEAAPLKSGYTVAVLPVYNATNDVAGAEMVRNLFYVKAGKYFTVKPMKEVDRLLLDRMGITLGSQLDMTTAQKLGEALGVVYGYLLNFDDITTGVYNARRVRSGFKLVDTRSGDVIWSKGLGVKSVTGLADLPVADGEVPVKGAADIPGINEWQTLAKVTFDDLRPQTKEDLMAVAALEAALTVLSLGLHFTGVAFGGHLKTESAVMVNGIMETLPVERGAAEERPGKTLPKLIFPAFTVYAGRDFTASIAVTTVESAQRGKKKKTAKTIKLAKLGEVILSENYLERVTAIINRGEMKGYLLYHASKRYAEVDLSGVNFDTRIVKTPAGEETAADHPTVRSGVRFVYPDGTELKGNIWEASDLDGFVVKAETDDGGGKTLVEVRDLSLKAPPAELFKIPAGYVKNGP